MAQTFWEGKKDLHILLILQHNLFNKINPPWQFMVEKAKDISHKIKLVYFSYKEWILAVNTIKTKFLSIFCWNFCIELSFFCNKLLSNPQYCKVFQIRDEKRGRFEMENGSQRTIVLQYFIRKLLKTSYFFFLFFFLFTKAIFSIHFAPLSSASLFN